MSSLNLMSMTYLPESLVLDLFKPSIVKIPGTLMIYCALELMIYFSYLIEILLVLCSYESDLHERVDFVACLGGDGVILHASNLFRDAVPPVVSFNLGSLGFLTSHTVSCSVV